MLYLYLTKSRGGMIKNVWQSAHTFTQLEIRATLQSFEVKSLLLDDVDLTELWGSVSRGTSLLQLKDVAEPRLWSCPHCMYSESEQIKCCWRCTVAIPVFSGNSASPLKMLNIVLCSWNLFSHPLCCHTYASWGWWVRMHACACRQRTIALSQ